jgi:hypothetical protein
VPAAGDNLLFYHDIRKYSAAAYLEALLAAMAHDGAPPSRLERMYAEQIVACARIADRKFGIFRFAIWITICGLTTPVVALALYLITHRSPAPAPRRADTLIASASDTAALRVPEPDAG